MARLKERQTGAVVNVPDEKVDQVLALGYNEPVDGPKKQAAKKAPAKKSTR
jgi:hypothetical protein